VSLQDAGSGPRATSQDRHEQPLEEAAQDDDRALRLFESKPCREAGGHSGDARDLDQESIALLRDGLASKLTRRQEEIQTGLALAALDADPGPASRPSRRSPTGSGRRCGTGSLGVLEKLRTALCRTRREAGRPPPRPYADRSAPRALYAGVETFLWSERWTRWLVLVATGLAITFE